MIRTVRIPRTVPRMGDILPFAADPISMAANAAYGWFVPAIPSGCYGGGANIDQAACTAAGNAAAAELAITNPAAAQDYQDASTGDLIALANPFTGTGPLTSISSGIPAWLWLTGGGIAAFALLKK